jgi:hypothetical protein
MRDKVPIANTTSFGYTGLVGGFGCMHRTSNGFSFCVLLLRMAFLVFS